MAHELENLAVHDLTVKELHQLYEVTEEEATSVAIACTCTCGLPFDQAEAAASEAQKSE